jgi:predicted dehydrogenase
MIRHSGGPISRPGGALVTPSGLTVGIVGLGYGRAHISAFQAHGCRVVALCQRDRAGATKLAERHGVPQVFERWEEMLDTARPEIVVVATPPHLHHAIVMRALAGGAHVLCEKPLAMTAAEGRLMADAARRAGRVAMTSFNWRFPAAMQELQALAREGAVGRVFHLAGRWLGGRFADPATAATWRVDRAQAGHGAMGDQGVHLIDIIRSAFGEFRRVTALAGTAFPSRALPGMARPADAEDYCMVLAELEGGAEVTLNVSRAAHGMMEHTLEVFGERGALAYRMVREGRWWDGELRMSEKGAGFRPVTPRRPGTLEAAGADVSEIIGKATIAPIVARFLDGIRAGVTPSPSFEDGVRAQAVLDAVLESISRRGWVEVPPATPR